MPSLQMPLLHHKTCFAIHDSQYAGSHASHAFNKLSCGEARHVAPDLWSEVWPVNFMFVFISFNLVVVDFVLGGLDLFY